MLNHSLHQLWEEVKKSIKINNNIKDPNIIEFAKTIYFLGAIDYAYIKETIINSKEFSITEKLQPAKNLRNEVFEWVEKQIEEIEEKKIKKALKLQKFIEEIKKSGEEITNAESVKLPLVEEL